MTPIHVHAHGWLALLGELAAVFVALMYLGAPLVIYATHKVTTKPRFRVVNPGDRDVPSETAYLLAEAISTLRPLGFAPRVTLYQDDFAPDTKMWLAYFENEAALDYAIAVSAYGRVQQEWKHRAAYFEFVSMFGEEASITTNDSPIASVFAEVPQRVVTRFPSVADPAHLYFLHKGIVERFAGPGPKSRPREADPIEVLTAAMVRAMEQQIETGYYRRDEAQEKFRPTLLGALLMTWKSLPPWKQLRRVASDRRAAEIERELVRGAA